MSVVNGYKIENYKDFRVKETGLAVPEAESLYMPQVSNGFRPDDFIVDSSLVLYLPLWALKGGSFNSVDGYSHTCTVTGALWQPDGRLFDGASLIDCGNAASLNIEAAITVEAWVKRAASGAWHTVVSKFDTNANQRAWVLWFRDTDAFGAYISRTGASGTVTDLSTVATYADTDYHHVAFTYLFVGDGSSVLKVFVDGAEEATTSTAIGDIFVSSEPVRVGALQLNNVNARFFNGDIGEIRIYNRNLSLAELQHNRLVTIWRYQ